jgi:hypothetical protein
VAHALDLLYVEFSSTIKDNRSMLYMQQNYPVLIPEVLLQGKSEILDDITEVGLRVRTISSILNKA